MISRGMRVMSSISGYESKALMRTTTELSTVSTHHPELQPAQEDLRSAALHPDTPPSPLLISTSTKRMKFSIARNIHYKSRYADKSALIHCSTSSPCLSLYCLSRYSI